MPQHPLPHFDLNTENFLKIEAAKDPLIFKYTQLFQLNNLSFYKKNLKWRNNTAYKELIYLYLKLNSLQNMGNT